MREFSANDKKIAKKYGIDINRACVSNIGHGPFVIEEIDYKPAPNPTIEDIQNHENIKGIKAYRIYKSNGKYHKQSLAFIGYTIQELNEKTYLILEAACFPQKYTREYGEVYSYFLNQAIKLKAEKVINNTINVPDKIV